MNAQQLKNSILQLAIQGKLVEQRPEEGTAKELLQEISAEKRRLIQEGKIKKAKPLPEISEDEIPFEVPESWEWVRLDNVCLSIADGDHQAPPKTNIGVPFLVISNVSNGNLDFSNTRFVPEDYFLSLPNERIAKRNDILFTVTGSYGISILVKTDRKFCFQRHIALIKSSRITDYLLYVLKSPLIKHSCDDVATGTAQKTVSLGALKNMLVPIPPLKEQHRIVSKIEELLPYIDQYDKAYTKLTAWNKKFPEAIRQSILQYAMEGKLVEQRPEEGTAEELLQEISAEKRRLIQEGKIKKAKPLPEISENEIPFEVPESWEWVRLGEITINRDSERIPLSVAQRDKLEKIFDYYGASGIIDKVDCYLFDQPLLLIGEDGANLLMRNKPIAFIAKGKYWVNNHAHVLDCYAGILMEYLMHYVNSISLAPFVTGTAQPKMNQAKMNNIIVPLPPLAEQKRIVTRIEELLSYCEQLKEAQQDILI